MRRRDVIGFLGGAAAWPLAARAQQPAMPVIGFVRSTSLGPFAHFVTAFRQGLKEAGFIEGQNVVVEYHAADAQPERLRALVADLVRRPVAVIVGNNDAALLAKTATTTVPIVFATGADPVRDGLVASLNRPGGNVTGAVFFSSTVGPKRLDLLRQLVPHTATIAMLVSPNSRNTEAERREVQAAAQAIGQPLTILDITSDREIETAIATSVDRGAGALLVGAGAFMNTNRKRLVEFAARHRLPASYGSREAVVDGGLMSYASSTADAYRQVGLYAGRILKGEKPADLPVVRPTTFEFVLNLKTARTLGLDVPDKLLALADEVIE
jgi:putative tryptophan/tyrosine transport system substrate-binding protein